MRRIAPLLLLALAACTRPSTAAPAAIDCAAVGRPELGRIEPLDCGALVERRFQPLLAAGGPIIERTPSHDPLVVAAQTQNEALADQAAALCIERNRCEVDEARFRSGLDQLEARAGLLRRLVQEATPAANTRTAARRQLATTLGVAPPLGSKRPVVCPTDMTQSCTDGTCAPTGASCCGDGTHCPSGSVCDPAGTCEPSAACGGTWPQACPDGTCVPAGAACCGEGRFCRSGSCCGEGACCASFEACVAGRCVPGAQSACGDPGRPIACPDGVCAPVGGSCCGEGRICESGTCCGDGACCFSGEQCIDGSCVGPAEVNPTCRADWPVTCADGSCAPSGAACCGEGRFCAAGSACCGTSCCLPGEVCQDGACLGG